MDVWRPQAAQPTAYEVLHVRVDAHPQVIAAAYRALAAVYHPDADPTPGATRRMAQLNDAYAQLRTPEARSSYDRAVAQAARPVMTAPAPDRSGRAGNSDGSSRPLDFGRYAGWTIEDLARHDPDYLRWLRRHSSGLRFRREIDERLRFAASATDAQRRNVWNLRSRRSWAAA